MTVLQQPDWATIWQQKQLKKSEWWIWTGGWYEMEGEKNYYTNWPLTSESVVVEAGAYEGAFAKTMIEKYDCQYYGFEPAKRAYNVAVKKLEGTGAHLYNIGLWDKDETRILYNSQRDGASIFDESYAGAVSEQVTFQDVKTALESVKHIDLFVMNIEGAEFTVLPRIIELGLDIDRFMIQWHSVFDGANEQQEQIQVTLAQRYKMIWNLGAWEAWERLMNG